MGRRDLDEAEMFEAILHSFGYRALILHRRRSRAQARQITQNLTRQGFTLQRELNEREEFMEQIEHHYRKACSIADSGSLLFGAELREAGVVAIKGIHAGVLEQDDLVQILKKLVTEKPKARHHA